MKGAVHHLLLLALCESLASDVHFRRPLHCRIFASDKLSKEGISFLRDEVVNGEKKRNCSRRQKTNFYLASSPELEIAAKSRGGCGWQVIVSVRAYPV